MPIQDEFGRIGFFEDFHGYNATASIADATAGTRFNDISIIALSGAVDFILTVDEPNGVASFSGAGGASDGVAIIGSPMQASLNGALRMGARFKGASATDLRIFVGFQETVSLSETVNPFTLSGTTLTANNGGEVVGFYTDTAATVDDYRFQASSAGVADTTAALDYAREGSTTLGALGIRAGCTITADSYVVVRVEVNPDGSALGFIGGAGMGNQTGLTHVVSLRAGTFSSTALVYPILQIAASSTGDPLLEVDYIWAKGNRDWTF